MRFLCIIPHYHAKNSANNICMMSIVEKIWGGGHSVDILCTDNEREDTKKVLKMESILLVFAMNTIKQY